MVVKFNLVVAVTINTRNIQGCNYTNIDNAIIPYG